MSEITPAQSLAKRICQRLINKKLLSSETASKIELKIADGKMQSPDWKLVFEKELNLHKQA